MIHFCSLWSTVKTFMYTTVYCVIYICMYVYMYTYVSYRVPNFCFAIFRLHTNANFVLFLEIIRKKIYNNANFKFMIFIKINDRFMILKVANKKNTLRFLPFGILLKFSSPIEKVGNQIFCFKIIGIIKS